MIILLIIHQISIESSHDQLPLEPLVMDQLLSEMIRECGSYLEVDDYFDFSISRIIYIALNTSMSLTILRMKEYIKYEYNFKLNVYQMPLLKRLQVKPSIFNKYIKCTRINENRNIIHSKCRIIR